MSLTLEKPASIQPEPENRTAQASPSLQDALIRRQLEETARQVLNELAIYESYEQNWDGYGAPEFEPELLRKAREVALFALEVCLAEGVVPDRVTPGPASDGSVELEFKMGERLVSFFLEDGNGVIQIYRREGTQSLDERRYREYVERALEGAILWLACG